MCVYVCTCVVAGMFEDEEEDGVEGDGSKKGKLQRPKSSAPKSSIFFHYQDLLWKLNDVIHPDVRSDVLEDDCEAGGEDAGAVASPTPVEVKVGTIVEYSLSLIRKPAAVRVVIKVCMFFFVYWCSVCMR